MILLAIDPGHSRKKGGGLGWATFDLKNGKHLDHGQILMEDLADLLKNLQPRVIVYESFRNRPWNTGRRWSENEESQIIGGLQMYGAMASHAVDLVKQEPGQKDIGIMWSGVKVPRNHQLSHEVDAYGHGVHYLVKNGIRTVPSYHQQKEIA